MCTRFYVEKYSFGDLISRAQKLEIADTLMRKFSKPLTMCGEIRPTDMTAVLAPNKDGRMAVFPMIWGFTHKASTAPIVNCRLETADKKEMWKDSWFRRRCVIPASWYYEWEHFKSPDGTKQKVGDKFLIQQKDSHTTLIAGLYRVEEHYGVKVPVFSVITRDAAGELKRIHERMPLVINKEDAAEWIRPDSDPHSIADRAVTEMYFERQI